VNHEDPEALARTAISAGALPPSPRALSPHDRATESRDDRSHGGGRDRRRGGVGIDRGDVVADAAAADRKREELRYGDATTAASN